MVRKIAHLVLLALFVSVSSSLADEWQVRFKIANMESAGKGAKVERFVRNLYGVDEVDLNFPAGSISVTFESSDIDLNTLKDKIVAADFHITKTIPLLEG